MDRTPCFSSQFSETSPVFGWMGGGRGGGVTGGRGGGGGGVGRGGWLTFARVLGAAGVGKLPPESLQCLAKAGWERLGGAFLIWARIHLLELFFVCVLLWCSSRFGLKVEGKEEGKRHMFGGHISSLVRLIQRETGRHRSCHILATYLLASFSE